MYSSNQGKRSRFQAHCLRVFAHVSNNTSLETLGTGKLIDKSRDGIAGSNPSWIVSHKIGKQAIDLFVGQAIHQIEEIISNPPK